MQKNERLKLFLWCRTHLLCILLKSWHFLCVVITNLQRKFQNSVLKPQGHTKHCKLTLVIKNFHTTKNLTAVTYLKSFQRYETELKPSWHTETRRKCARKLEHQFRNKENKSVKVFQNRKVGGSKDNINIAATRGMFAVFESMNLMLYLYITVTGLSNSNMMQNICLSCLSRTLDVILVN